MKKPRGDSLKARLRAASTPEADLCRLVVEWAMEDALSYDEIAKRLHAHGVETSVGALCNFVQRHSLSWRLDVANRQTAELAEEMPEAIGEELKRAALAKVYGLTFEEMTAKDAVKIAALAVRNIRDEAAMAALERRLKIAEEQHAAAMRVIDDAKKAVADGQGLTPETLETIEKQLRLIS